MPPSARDPASTAPAAGWAIPGYAVEGVLGRGASGTVLAARRIDDERPAAVKLAPVEQARSRIQLGREAAALRAIGAPLAPEVLGEGTLEDGTRWLATERFGLPALAARLRDAGGSLAPGSLRAPALALADALADLHARGWCHGDLKPGHVFLPDRGGARLIDFGLAGRPGDAAAPPLAPDGGFAGTPAYMSPEQARGETPDARSDVYAAGAILFEALTGRPPFVGAPGEVRQAHLARRPPHASELAPVPAPLDDVVARCLAKHPAARFADGAALRGALAAAWDVPGKLRTSVRRSGPAPARRLVGILRLESSADVLAVKRAAEGAGGRLAHASGGRYAVVFEPGARENAVRLALDGAHTAIEAGLAMRVVVDLATVAVLEGASGPRYLGAFDRAEGFARAGDPTGTLVTANAAAAVPDAAVEPCPGRDDLLRVIPAAERSARPTPIVGRGEVLARILTAAAEALDRSAPAIVSVVGEAGIGKSAVGAELAARLRARPDAPDVLEVRARETLAGEDETLRALLAFALGVSPRPAPPDGGRTALGEVLPPVVGGGAWAPVALALGWIAADAPALRPWRASPGALRAAVVRAAGEAVRARARTRALCVLVDDAHLADPTALDAVEYAALAEAATRIFVCAFARPTFASSRPSLGERAASTLAVELGPLDAADAAELCRRLLLPAESVPARAVERLVERARGVPVLLVELVRGLRAQGLVRQRGHDGQWYVATDELDLVPEMPLVEWLAQREIAGLPEALAAHARLVALLGDGVAPAEVAGIVAELDRDGVGSSMTLDPEVASRRLVELRVLSEHDGRLAFRHPLQREAIARSAAEAERRAVHRAAFRFYLLAATLPERERLPRLAFHAEASGLRPEAASLWLRIAEDLRARHAYIEAEALYTRALGQLAPEDSRGRFVTLRGRGLVRYRVGRYEDAIADLASAQERARALRDREGEMECVLDEATALDWMHDYARSAERVTSAERLAGARRSPLAAARLELAHGRSLFRAGKWPEAAAALEAAGALAEPLGDEGYEAHVVALLLLGGLLPGIGRSADAEATLARALELASSRGDALHAAVALNNRRNLWVARGAPDRAIEDLTQYVRIGRDLGMVGVEYIGQFNIGELLYQTADVERAERHVLRAVEIERRHPEVAARPIARLLWARLLAYRGDAHGASARLAEVRGHEDRAHGDGNAGALLGPSDRVLAEMVELATRGGSEPEWRALCARSRAASVEQEPIEVHEMYALAARRAGRAAEAEAALRDALELAARIPNVMGPRLQAAFPGGGARSG